MLPGSLEAHPWLEEWDGLVSMDSRLLVKIPPPPSVVRERRQVILSWLAKVEDGMLTAPSSTYLCKSPRHRMWVEMSHPFEKLAVPSSSTTASHRPLTPGSEPHHHVTAKHKQLCDTNFPFLPLSRPSSRSARGLEIFVRRPVPGGVSGSRLFSSRLQPVGSRADQKGRKRHPKRFTCPVFCLEALLSFSVQERGAGHETKPSLSIPCSSVAKAIFIQRCGVPRNPGMSSRVVDPATERACCEVSWGGRA